MNGLLIIGSAVMIALALSIILFVLVYQRRSYEEQHRIITLELSNQRRLIEAEIKATEREQKRIYFTSISCRSTRRQSSKSCHQ